MKQAGIPTMSEEKKPKAPKAPPKPKPEFVPLTFTGNQFPGCCGIFAPNMFTEQLYTYDYSQFHSVRKETPKQFFSRKEQAEACVKAIEDGAIKNLSYQIMVALVWKYGPGQSPTGLDTQLPELQQALLDAGYVVDHEWLAPRHGNTLRVYSKLLPYEPKPTYDNDEEEEDELEF